MVSRRGKLVIGGVVGVLLLGSIVGIATARARGKGVEVRLEEVKKRDLVARVTASGNVRPRRTVDMSSDVSARVSQLLVREGDDVRAGQVLMRLDPTQFQAVASRARAGLSQAQAQTSQQEASLLRAERDYQRLRNLSGRDSVLVSPQQLQDAATNVEVAQATLEAARQGVAQARASVEEADDRLAKTVFRAPIDGKVTRLQVEEGETVIIGTMNNPGSLILTVSDLGVVEVVVQVDETDVPELSIGDSASVKIDAYPGQTFTGKVTEIGNSAIRPPSSQSAAGAQQAAIDFEVVVTLDNPPAILRPDLSATADIVTDTRVQTNAIPIIALTVRSPSDTLARPKGGFFRRPKPPAIAAERDPNEKDMEGVFKVNGGKVTFVPVTVGVAGDEYFEVVSGVAVGDTVVAGPYTAIRQLKAGDPVRPLKPTES
ncbi:MAG: efflux RND transporter periplasmic adaptor subunit [Gemmatimonadetes bacterium]|nr:efflux RND transporter periplasmic adaptor subunit [Gemmatimonadota bacterium]